MGYNNFDKILKTFKGSNIKSLQDGGAPSSQAPSEIDAAKAAAIAAAESGALKPKSEARRNKSRVIKAKF